MTSRRALPVGDLLLRRSLGLLFPDGIVPLTQPPLLTHAPQPTPAAASIRELALRRALDFIEAHAAEAPRIADVCTASKASERTLRYAFQERFDMSPKGYLQAVRLNGVRRELRRRGDRPTVGAAAHRWGFWHLGQFAADYRRLFGELPSETSADGRRG